LRTTDFAAYHQNFHTSAAELANLASRARPKTLLLVHQLHMGVPDRVLVEEVRLHWDGVVLSGSDLDVLPLPSPGA